MKLAAFSLAVTIALGSTCALAQTPSTPAVPPAEVVVLSTLHQFHAKVRGYGYAELARTVDALQPKVLGLELTPQDVADRIAQPSRPEYPKAVYPLLEARRYTAVGLEPSGALRTRLLQQNATADREFLAQSPEQAKAFEGYVTQLFTFLLERWKSTCDVNSPETDALLEVKHRFQDAVAPAAQAAAWDGWNQHLLAQIRRAAYQHRGQRIVALVGVEHAYWLRAQLAQDPSVRLLDAAALLRETCMLEAVK